MTATDFTLLCGELLIEPALALENPAIQAALKARAPREEIKRLLTTEF